LDAIVDALRQEIEHHPDGVSAVSVAGPVRSVTRATLDLMSDASAEAIPAAALREAVAEATDTEVDVGLLVGAATSTARSAWERLVEARPTKLELEESGRRVLLALHVLGAGLVDAYGAAEFELATNLAEARRSFLDELLNVPPRDRTEALRRRRRAERYGLDPETSFRLTLASPGQRASDADLDAMLVAVKRGAAAPPPPRLSTLRFPDISELEE